MKIYCVASLIYISNQKTANFLIFNIYFLTIFKILIYLN